MHVWLIAFLLLVAPPAWSQGKPEAQPPGQSPPAGAPASLVGTWDVTGRNIEQGIVHTPSGGVLVVERDLGNGRYEGHVTIESWESCPQPGRAHEDGGTECRESDDYESRVLLEVVGTRVRITELDREPSETFEYDIDGNRLRFRLDSCRCEDTNFAYVMRAPGAPAPQPAPRPTPTPAPAPAPTNKSLAE